MADDKTLIRMPIKPFAVLSEMRAFVTVGSISFDSLITEIFSSRTLNALKDRGYTTLIVQCGTSTFAHAASVSNGETASLELEGVAIELWKFKPSLNDEYEKADLVIGHAGQISVDCFCQVEILTSDRRWDDHRDPSATKTSYRCAQFYSSP